VTSVYDWSMALRRPLRLLLALSLSSSGAAAIACSGSSDDSGGGGTHYTLDNVCEEIAPKICALQQGCCTSSGIGFDEPGCKTYQLDECNPNVAEVKAGTMTFDASQVDPCLAGIKPLFEACRVAYPDLLQYFSALRACEHVFVGQNDEGALCDRDAQCKPSEDPKTLVGCEGGRCKWSRVVGSGATCDFDDLAPHLCDAGLYCDIATGGTSGTCKTATALGQACDPVSLECGIGAFCQASTQTCVEASNEGDSCVSPFQCKSLQCTAGSCEAVAPPVEADDCGK
jgi:hypothetical protein